MGRVAESPFPNGATIRGGTLGGDLAFFGGFTFEVGFVRSDLPNAYGNYWDVTISPGFIAGFEAGPEAELIPDGHLAESFYGDAIIGSASGLFGAEIAVPTSNFYGDALFSDPAIVSGTYGTLGFSFGITRTWSVTQLFENVFGPGVNFFGPSVNADLLASDTIASPDVNSSPDGYGSLVGGEPGDPNYKEHPTEFNDLPHPDYAKSSSGYDPHEVGSAHWDAYGPGLKDYGTAPSDIPYDGQAFDVHTSLVAPHPTGPIHQPPVPGLHPTDLIVAPTWWNKPVVAQPSLTPEQVAAIERQEAIDDFRSKYGEHHGFKTGSQLDKFYDAYGEFVPPGQIIVRDLVNGQWDIIPDPSYEGNGGRPSAANDIENGEYGGANGDPNVSGGSDSQPIILDLNGNGIEITTLSESTVFMAGKDGLDHKIAWAAAGDGVLFYDPDGTGDITERESWCVGWFYQIDALSQYQYLKCETNGRQMCI